MATNNQYKLEITDKNRTDALLHTAEMEKRHEHEIIMCANATKIYNTHFGCGHVKISTPVMNVYTIPTTSVDAAIKFGGSGKTAILNFASLSPLIFRHLFFISF